MVVYAEVLVILFWLVLVLACAVFQVRFLEVPVFSLVVVLELLFWLVLVLACAVFQGGFLEIPVLSLVVALAVPF